MSSFTSDIVIGLEVHVELNTKTKLFCSCPTKGNEEPNTRVCPVCLGHPGSKPVLNRKAVEFALKLCTALNSKISSELVFSRKSYFYPDMSKNYQITQYEIPLGAGGALSLKEGREIALKRVHMEEDPASLVHSSGMQESGCVLVDYNRSGNPLIEIVTEPCLASPEEARDFMKQLITVLSYLEIFDENHGIIKADANVSVRESGYVRVEVKNITGFREIERALSYEVVRQKSEAGHGRKLAHETRSWDSARGITFALRKKEAEEDYGYIIDPDLVISEIGSEWIENIRNEMPELAQDKVRKFIEKYKIGREDAQILASEKALAEMFEKVAGAVDPELAAKWLRRELLRVLNYSRKSLDEVGITEKHMIDLLRLVQEKKITDNVASRLLEKLVENAFDIVSYVKKEALEAVSDADVLEKYCIEAIKENPVAVEDYRKGEAKSLNFIVGQVMRKTKGKAAPKEVNEIILRILNESQ